jgi:hypothetical protein
MTVLLLTSASDLPAGRPVVAVTGTARPEGSTALPGLAVRLEAAFDAIRDDWQHIAHGLRRLDGPGLAVMTTTAANISDFGLMMAWRQLAGDLVQEPEEVILLCDDAMMFRALAALPGIIAGPPPGLLKPVVRGVLRGLAARAAVTLRCLRARLTLGRQRPDKESGGKWILVYGHPASNAEGHDAYFGGMMQRQPGLRRVLHTDCDVGTARRLGADGRSHALHGWGSPRAALTAIRHWWRPSHGHLDAGLAWLVRRAMLIENSGGAIAMNAWQHHCQARWLAEVKPELVAWPWENHGWERQFVPAARSVGARTVGYQHTVVGRHQYNFAAASNLDPAAEAPDLICCNSPRYLEQLRRWRQPGQEFRLAGAFRIRRIERNALDTSGPVYVALCPFAPIAAQMIDAIGKLADDSLNFVVKDHPLYPFDFRESAWLKRTDKTIPDFPAMRAVLYSTGATGLEGLLSGVPTLRYLPDDRIAPDTLPDGIPVTTVTAETLGSALRNLPAPATAGYDDIFADVDQPFWDGLFSTETGTPHMFTPPAGKSGPSRDRKA